MTDKERKALEPNGLIEKLTNARDKGHALTLDWPYVCEVLTRLRAAPAAPAEPPKDGEVAALVDQALDDWMVTFADTESGKKPVVIEAVQWTGSNYPTVKDFVGIDVQVIHHMVHESLSIPTLEGTMCATKGDYIIRGVKGEIYPCKPDIFAATYEPADAAPVPAREWIPVGERLPERDAVVLTCGTMAGPTVARFIGPTAASWKSTDDSEDWMGAKFWMPLPPPPAAD